MIGTTFPVSPDVTLGRPLPIVEHLQELRTAFRRPIEALWQPSQPLVYCGEEHALLSAFNSAFYQHYPLVLSPDIIWLTLAHGFALHINMHAEDMRHRFVTHSGKKKLVVARDDFLPGQENPWHEAFDQFAERVDEEVGKLVKFLRCDFSTTGLAERAASSVIVMDTCQTYFEYELLAGCGIPSVTLNGTVEDWKSVRDRAQLFSEFGLETWSNALDPVLAQFVNAVEGNLDQTFWQSAFRYQSGSGPSVMTGWAVTLFPYLKGRADELYPNPYLSDWEDRLQTFDAHSWQHHRVESLGVGLGAVPNCLANAPVRVFWGDEPVDMRFIGGLMGVSQDGRSNSLQPECGWAVIYEEPVDELSPRQRQIERLRRF